MKKGPSGERGRGTNKWIMVTGRVGRTRLLNYRVRVSLTPHFIQSNPPDSSFGSQKGRQKKTFQEKCRQNFALYFQVF